VSDSRRAAELRKREKFVRQQQDSDVRRLMAEPHGRRFVYRLLYGLCGLEASSVHSSGSITYLNEGRRAVAIELKGALHRVCPADYVRMVQEAVFAQQEDEARREGVADSAETDDGGTD
jgi:hypothetical protein